ncbi:MAG: Thiamine-phosphate synthase [Chlamydiales bacterium]|nr:Thiamine-phosphate synthase [Chlamydiales bacterium]
MRMAITPEEVTIEQIRAVCAGPIDALQLRRKKLAAKPLYAFAQECRQITHANGVKLIMNDRLDIALSVKADGVHLPQRGLPACVVKNVCPAHFLVGVSTHTDEEAREAAGAGASYITFCAHQLTPELVQNISVPILALGNVTAESIPHYLNRGAAGYAAIRLFFS